MNNINPDGRRAFAVGVCAAFATGIVLVGAVADAAAERAQDRVKPVFSTELPNVPGKSLTVILVRYAPGEKSPSHVHAGSVLAYVLSGSIRSQNSATGPARVYQTGESFFEPPGSVHMVSENASDTAPASLLAVFVADNGAELTRRQK
jgi:quercetin dioxygenase-like cupin family protein